MAYTLTLIPTQVMTIICLSHGSNEHVTQLHVQVTHTLILININKKNFFFTLFFWLRKWVEFWRLKIWNIGSF
jgi:hypothetical protein